MPDKLQTLIDAAKDHPITPAEQEAQRRSFAYGNTHFENERITRATVDRAAEALESKDEKNRHPKGQ